MRRFEDIFQDSLVSEVDAAKQSKTSFLFKKEEQALRQEYQRYQLERNEKLQRALIKHQENVRQIRLSYQKRRTEVSNGQ